MKSNPEQTYKFLEQRKLEPIPLKCDLSDNIAKIFVPLNKDILKDLIKQTNLEEKPDLCVISKARISKFQDEVYFFCTPTTSYRFYTLEDEKLKIVKNRSMQEDGTLGKSEHIKMNTLTQSFLTKVAKDGWKRFYPLTKNKTNKKAHIDTYNGERESEVSSSML